MWDFHEKNSMKKNRNLETSNISKSTYLCKLQFFDANEIASINDFLLTICLWKKIHILVQFWLEVGIKMPPYIMIIAS